MGWSGRLLQFKYHIYVRSHRAAKRLGRQAGYLTARREQPALGSGAVWAQGCHTMFEFDMGSSAALAMPPLPPLPLQQQQQQQQYHPQYHPQYPPQQQQEQYYQPDATLDQGFGHDAAWGWHGGEEHRGSYEYGADETYGAAPGGAPTLHASVTDRLHLQYALHPLTHDEMVTYRSMLERDENAEIWVMPTHHIDESGTLHGFRLVVGRGSDCVNLPVTREMFHGHTSVECDPGDRDIHPDVIRLLTSPEYVKQAVLGMLAEVAAYKPDTMAGWDHMPIYGDTSAIAVTADDSCTGKERTEILLQNLIDERLGRHSTVMRGRDSKQWHCDMPTGVGVFHAHVRSRDSGQRHHKLFIVISGGTRRASEGLYNMNLDLLGNASAAELESCEETYWLRRTNTRCRCRLAQKLADALDLQVPTALDIHDFEDAVSIPVFTTDTFEHNISEADDGRTQLFNGCCDTTAVSNGILSTQNPSEGLWCFQGSHQSAISGLTNMGGQFGDQGKCGAFPTGTFHMYEDAYQDAQLNGATCGSASALQSQQHQTRLNLHKETVSNHVLYYNPVDGTQVSGEALDLEGAPDFVKVDEAFLKHLETHDWNRSYEIVQMIPVLYAVENVPHWLKH